MHLRFDLRDVFRRIVPITLMAIVCFAAPLRAQPTPGFVEQWPGTSLQGWGGGSSNYDNPGTGGVLGAGDGYLHVGTAGLERLGAVSFGQEYTGDWIAAGITHVRVWLKDVGPPEALEIHFSLGNTGNFWQYNAGLPPSPQTWTAYDIDLTSSANFTQIIGSGTFASALHSTDRVLLRHDHAPYVQPPDLIQADFGIDELELTSGPTAVSPTTWGRIKSLYR